MHPKIFIRSMEEQLRRVKLQYRQQMYQDEPYYDIGHDELLSNAQTWFLRTIENTDLQADELTISAVEYLEAEALSRSRIPPFGLLYPSILWMISTLDRSSTETIFGIEFCSKMDQAILSVEGAGNDTAAFRPMRG